MEEIQLTNFQKDICGIIDSIVDVLVKSQKTVIFENLASINTVCYEVNPGKFRLLTSAS